MRTAVKIFIFHTTNPEYTSRYLPRSRSRGGRGATEQIWGTQTGSDRKSCGRLSAKLEGDVEKESVNKPARPNIDLASRQPKLRRSTTPGVRTMNVREKGLRICWVDTTAKKEINRGVPLPNHTLRATLFSTPQALAGAPRNNAIGRECVGWFYQEGIGPPRITWQESVDEALRGIDRRRETIDAESAK